MIDSCLMLARGWASFPLFRSLTPEKKMFPRMKILSAAAVWSTLPVDSASAHDPSKYSNDVANPDINALRMRCDAAKKTAVDSGQ